MMFSKSLLVIALLATPFNGSIGGVLALDDAKVKGIVELHDLQDTPSTLLRGTMVPPLYKLKEIVHEDYLDGGFLQDVVHPVEVGEAGEKGCKTSGGCCLGGKCCSGYTCHQCQCKYFHTPREKGEPCWAAKKCDTSKFYCTTGFKCADRPKKGESCGGVKACMPGLYCHIGTLKCEDQPELWESCGGVKTCKSPYKCGDDFKCHKNPRRKYNIQHACKMFLLDEDFSLLSYNQRLEMDVVLDSPVLLVRILRRRTSDSWFLLCSKHSCYFPSTLCRPEVQESGCH